MSEVRGSEDFVSISIAFKRIKNILRPWLEDRGDHRSGVAIEEGSWTPEKLEERAERDLAMMIPSVRDAIKQLAQQRKYQEAVSKVAELRRPVDTFFDEVMVMVDDEQVRERRLTMLMVLLMAVGTIADFSEIVTDNKTPNSVTVKDLS